MQQRGVRRAWPEEIDEEELGPPGEPRPERPEPEPEPPRPLPDPPPDERRRKFYYDGGRVEIAAHLVYELDPESGRQHPRNTATVAYTRRTD